MHETRSATVLVVDDDGDFRALIAPTLEARSHRVLHAATVRDGLAVALRERPGAILVDQVLPDGEGVELVASLRRERVAARILFLSSVRPDAARYQRLTGELGVALVLQKPVVPVLLADQIDGLLREPAPVGDAPGIESQLQVLRRAYAAALPEKLEELSRALAVARDGTRERQAAKLLAHRLAGTAGSYGFAEVGAAAARIEGALAAGAEPAWGELAQQLAAVRPVEREPQLAAPPARVLLADSDDELVAPLAELSHKLPLEIVRAKSASEALSHVAPTAPFKLALLGTLTDADSPWELARALRTVSGGERLPLAVVSREAGLEHRVAAAHAGAALFLERPVGPSALEGAVRQLLTDARAERVRILLVDDDQEFAQGVALVLRHAGMEVGLVHDPHQLHDALDEHRPDLLLLDVVLPGVSGFDLCRTLRATPKWQLLPILFLTAKSSLESRVAAFHAGGDDYLAKPILEEELLARVHVRVERARLLRERAERDALTGLLLRGPFLDGLTARIAEAARHQRPLALAMLDLDHFKLINDTYGHLVGDEVLVTMGRLLAARFRAEDLRGRWGGEEFILAFPNTDAPTARGMVTRLLDELAAIEFAGEHGERFYTSFSAGIVGVREGATTTALIQAADERLYQAKRAGRKRVVAD
jgi:diguanylate cyclase (GGDEF)-like protein